MRLRTKALFLAPVLGAAGVGVAMSNAFVAAVPAPPAVPKAGADAKASATLPVSQVVLFNSGVGYVGRAGEIDGDARVDLTFPETDINDLLKSLTLQDFDGGRVDSVSYDSREPVGRTLASFALDLNQNPTLAQILLQARGEKIEVALHPTAQALPGNLTGTIVGLENQKLPIAPGKEPIECSVLNILTADGLRAVKMPDVLRVKFLNPVLEAELKRALDVLALSHDSQKKAVTLNFRGEGKRKVKVGYVVEAPIWKTSYRLVLDKDAKPTLQGWAMVENPTDEDWSNVKMALVSGRPISFKMDLYNPLYVGRPTVEPELFASLRPPAYQGDIAVRDGKMGALRPTDMMSPPGGGGFGGGGFGGGMGGGATGAGGAGSPLADSATRRAALAPDSPAPAGGAGGDGRSKLAENERLQREQRADFAKKVGGELAQRMDLAAVQSAASAGQLGDFFQYVIDHPVSLARQKSALLPVVSKPVEGTRVSIYNPAVQAKHPLLGLKFKNTTGANLSQGPITVFEGSSYAGDARVLDLQPNEERLIAYAIDLGTEVVPQNGPGTANITSVKARNGVVTVTRKFREEKVYKATNRSTTDRVLLIEHPNRTNQQFKVVETPKPAEETAELLRFSVPLAAGKSTEFKVVEERDGVEMTQLNASDPSIFRFFLSLENASPAFKAKLKEAMALRAKLDLINQDAQRAAADVARITQDQDRIRKNLRETPEKADVYAKYLAKLSAQEKEIDALTERQKTLSAEQAAAAKAFAEFLQTIGD